MSFGGVHLAALIDLATQAHLKSELELVDSMRDDSDGCKRMLTLMAKTFVSVVHHTHIFECV